MPSCTRYLDKGFELVRQGGIGYSLTHAHCTQARLWLAQGETDKAQEALWQANQAAQASPLLHILLHNLACQTKLALLLGDVDGASRWVESDIGILGDLPPYLNEIRQISASRVYLTKGKFKKIDHYYRFCFRSGRSCRPDGASDRELPA